MSRGIDIGRAVLAMTQGYNVHCAAENLIAWFEENQIHVYSNAETLSAWVYSDSAPTPGQAPFEECHAEFDLDDFERAWPGTVWHALSKKQKSNPQTGN